ncbi:zinc ABC transporter substrate-binding protein [Candidatus Paracaedibacter symbiosus]|uniref:zinc ABC transporter substrate-binding protein n=1 Tax=Candidatus Paracaedibacter symbiosus TaxID=244582 RepID=UPI00050966DC|nr:zinc ABC transporter substrate-binding protein [Candidatus Paracaedibacter symbiosus]
MLKFLSVFFIFFAAITQVNAEKKADTTLTQTCECPSQKHTHKKPHKKKHHHHKKKKSLLGWQPHTPRVVVTIKPIHSLVAGVMEGIGEPELLIQDNSSPHVHAIKPSEADTLEKAEVIVWVGAIYETGLQYRLKDLEDSKTIIELQHAKDVILYPVREGGFWGSSSCCNSCESGPEAEENSPCNCHPHTEGHHHEPLSKDGHIWLAPNNAKAIVTQVAEELAALDPQHAPDYLANSKKVISSLNDLAREITYVVNPVKTKPYMMVHDFSQYFDRYFGTNGVGTIIDISHAEPTPKYLRTVQEKLNSGSAKCLLVEPQFNLKVTQMLIDDTGVATQQVDYLGGDLTAGPDCYFEIMRRFANSLVNCLG